MLDYIDRLAFYRLRLGNPRAVSSWPLPQLGLCTKFGPLPLELFCSSADVGSAASVWWAVSIVTVRGMQNLLLETGSRKAPNRSRAYKLTGSPENSQYPTALHSCCCSLERKEGNFFKPSLQRFLFC